MLVFITHSFTKINRLTIKLILKKNVIMEKQLTALPVNSIMTDTEWQQAYSFLYRKYCSIHAQIKWLYGITVSLASPLKTIPSQ